MSEPATRAVQNTMFRALAVLRFIVLANAIGLYIYHHDSFPHPVAGTVVLVAISVWTWVAIWTYDQASRRTSALLVSDLMVTLAAMLATLYVKGADFNATLPGFWVAGVVLAWAIQWGWRGGLLVALAVATTDFTMRDHFTQTNYANIFLIVVGGLVVGFLSGLLQQTAVERDRAERATAAAAERQRLGRIVHDGVLQVLALVQRRGVELGREGAELSRLAGEQEVALRAFVQHDAESDLELTGELDLGAALSWLATTQVSVAVPGSPVLLPALMVHEVAAIVTACLSNVRHHVAKDAPAWVLLEEVGPSIVVSVRDDGPGIAQGRLEAAAAEGRLGVSQSIRGRVQDLGGSAVLRTAASQGTEWEFTLPTDASR